MKGDFTTREEVRRVYRKRAGHYDWFVRLYGLIGFCERRYRRMAVEALGLGPGNTVVEIGCGTGLNFSLLQDEVGPQGRIIGVDLTDAMLAEAGKRIKAKGWSNVELVESAAASYAFACDVDGVLSTFALTAEPDYDRVIANGAQALKAGKRWVVLDLKLPSNWLKHLAPSLIFLIRPFAVSLETADRHPWESMERHLGNVTFKELFLGIAYIATGESP